MDRPHTKEELKIFYENFYQEEGCVTFLIVVVLSIIVALFLRLLPNKIKMRVVEYLERWIYNL